MARPARPTIPSAIGARVRDTVEATRDLWGGPAVDEVMAAIDGDARAVFGASVAPRWVAETIYMQWTQAVWDGPAKREAAALARWVDRLTDRGFGTARRMLMSLASPWVIVRRAGALWRTEHSHGELAAVPLVGSSVRFELRDHPFTSTEVIAAATSEAFRHIVYRCRVRWATETHELDGGALLVEIRWG
jgi:hypothetical protein